MCIYWKYEDTLFNSNISIFNTSCLFDVLKLNQVYEVRIQFEKLYKKSV